MNQEQKGDGGIVGECCSDRWLHKGTLSYQFNHGNGKLTSTAQQRGRIHTRHRTKNHQHHRKWLWRKLISTWIGRELICMFKRHSQIGKGCLPRASCWFSNNSNKTFVTIPPKPARGGGQPLWGVGWGWIQYQRAAEPPHLILDIKHDSLGMFGLKLDCATKSVTSSGLQWWLVTARINFKFNYVLWNQVLI